jgi:hypothetical protein
MHHTIEELIHRLEVMKNKAIELHRLRNQFSKLADKEYDHIKCQSILDDIQSMALLIAEDRGGTEIKTSMEYKKND